MILSRGMSFALPFELPVGSEILAEPSVYSLFAFRFPSLRTTKGEAQAEAEAEGLRTTSGRSFASACACDLAIRYSMTSVTTPAPTVRPPSRIANRSSFSIAIGLISSTVICTLSPGITISTPSGSFADPVTSVVRK